jgi:hypothetical protein
MTTNHVDFEVLCALAVIGDLTKAECDELSEHVEHCPLCHDRLLEMRRLGVQLFFAQARQTPIKRLPKGMQERFSARAISEGIPLSVRSQGVGFRSLGLVTVLLVALLLVTATLKDGPLGKPFGETGGVEISQAEVLHKEMRLPKGISDRPRGVRARRVPNHQVPCRLVNGPSVAVFLSAYPAPHSRQFIFTPYVRNSGMRAYPLSTTIRLPEVVPSFTSPHATPKLTLDATSEVFRHNAPHLLLAESDHGAFGLVHPPAQSFRGSLDLDAYLPAHLKSGSAGDSPGESPQ